MNAADAPATFTNVPSPSVATLSIMSGVLGGEPSWWPLLAAAAAACLGAVLQRSTGMGFALVTAPFLVLALGPVDGIIVTNAGSVLTSSLTAYQLRHDIEGARLRWLLPAGLIGCVPGALVVRLLPAAWIGLIVGVIVLIALLVSLVAPAGRLSDSGRTRATTGLISGFMNTSAGVGGPALAVYARSVGWERRGFAGTVSAIFAAQGLAAIVLKAHLPNFPALGWPMLLAAIVIGLVLGDRLHARLDDRAAMRLVMGLALLGTSAALVKAIATLLAG